MILSEHRKTRVGKTPDGFFANHPLVLISLSFILAGIALMTSGCAPVGPDYARVEPKAPDSWHTQMENGLTAGQTDPAGLAHWWTSLKDPLLSDLEKRAVQGNLDLRIARVRIREARTMRGISRAGFFPILDATTEIAQFRTSKSSGREMERKIYSAAFDSSWELDVFGGVKRSVEAADADIDASREELNDLLVSLMAEVALNYVEMRTFQSRLAVGRENIKAQEEIYKLNRSRNQAGIIGELAVQESLRILESSRSRIPTLEAEMDAAKNRLAVLLGNPPGSLHDELAEYRPLPSLPVTVAVGIPAETLRQRPDVRRAERNLAAQTAQIGVATAELYPKFSLAGTLGIEAVTPGDLLKGSSRIWEIGPGVTWNLFDANATRRNIQVQTLRREQFLIRYEHTVLKALEEVENALAAYAREQLRRDFVAKAAVAAERAAELANDQYQAGLVSFNNVLDAQRSLLLLRDGLAGSDGILLSNLIKLYKALGGGWTSETSDREEAATGLH